MKIKNPFIQVAAMAIGIALGVGASHVEARDKGDSERDRHLLVAKSRADFEYLRREVVSNGGRVVKEMRESNMLAVSASPTKKARLARSLHARAVLPDRVRRLVPIGREVEFFGNARTGTPVQVNLRSERREHRVHSEHGEHSMRPDPALALDGLMWNLSRIGVPDAWEETLGDRRVTVAVADTGVDYTHAELARRISPADVYDLGDSYCKDSTGVSDADLATIFGGPADGDWYGHGTWIAGTIAASLDRRGINGIAPNVRLVSLKVAGWCGSAYESTIIDSIYQAADLGVDVVSISFGGYDNRKDPAIDQLYRAFADAVTYARKKGTLIVAAAGNEHVRLGVGGRVLSHSSRDPARDLFGLWQVPAGLPGVVAVSATGNVVNRSSGTCAVASASDSNTTTCKPAGDPHRSFGAGRRDQLTHYSNYGPRIDIAAPGGSSKFNLPLHDRGGSFGWPWTGADGFRAWGDFGITSNWTSFTAEFMGFPVIPCFHIVGRGFERQECYSTIQGTSMATPHVAAAVALLASEEPRLRHAPAALLSRLKDGARRISGNTTPPWSATDTSPGDQSGVACRFIDAGASVPDAYCHLGGQPIPDREAYGAGLVDAERPL